MTVNVRRTGDSFVVMLRAELESWSKKSDILRSFLDRHHPRPDAGGSVGARAVGSQFFANRFCAVGITGSMRAVATLSVLGVVSAVAVSVVADPKVPPKKENKPSHPCDTDFDPTGEYELVLTSIPASSPMGMPQCTSFPTGKKIKFHYSVAADLKADTVRVRNLDAENAIIRDAKLGRQVSEACKQREGPKVARVRVFSWTEYMLIDEKEGLTFVTKGVGAGDVAAPDIPKALSIITYLQNRSGAPICYAKFDADS
jgi:hypothetical protein